MTRDALNDPFNGLVLARKVTRRLAKILQDVSQCLATRALPLVMWDSRARDGRHGDES
jgi:hypothetical protein